MSLIILFDFIDVIIYTWLFKSIASVKNVKTVHV